MCLCLAFWLALLCVFSAHSRAAAPQIDSPAVLVTANGAIASNFDVVSLLLGITWLRHDVSLSANTRVMPVMVNGSPALLPGPVDGSGVPLMGSVENPVPTLLPLLAAGNNPLFANGEAVFFSAQYPSLANDPLVIDTASVRVRIYAPDGSLLDEEFLQVTETTLDSGLFTGYFQNHPLAGGPGDGYVRLPPGARIEIVDVDDIPDGTLQSQIDAGIDSATPGTATLFISKRALQTVVAAGDFLPYEVTLENSMVAVASGVTVTDVLPRGFRYVRGSVTLDGADIAEPVIGEDGLTLTFSIGNVATGQRLLLRYVTEVTAGARPGKAINTALAAADGGVTSNPARAPVRVEEDLFRSDAFVLGRVLLNGCGKEQDNTSQGIANVRLFMEDGATVITDKFGRYHVAGIKPGTHVIQVDKESLPEGSIIEPCVDNTRFAGNGFSQFIDIQGGGLWRADFHVRQSTGPAAPAAEPDTAAQAVPASRVTLQMTSSSDLGFVHYRAVISGENAAFSDLALALKLDSSLQIVRGSTRRDGNDISIKRDNGLRLIALGNVSGNWTTTIEFDAMSSSDEKARDAIQEVETQAWLTATDLPAEKSPRAVNSVRLGKASGGDEVNITVSTVFPPMSATLSQLDKLKLDDVVTKLRELEEPYLTVTGHTDNIPIRKNPKKPLAFADNHALSKARAQAVADYLREQLGLPDDAVSVVGAGPDRPAYANTSQEERARNRRVEVAANSRTARAAGEISVVRADSDLQQLELTAAAPVLAPVDVVAPVAAEAPPEPVEEKLVPGILDFADGEHVAQRIGQIRVAMDSRLKPRLTIDDVEVPAARIGYRGADRKTKMTLMSYIGVDFGDRGERVIRITGTDTFGNVRLDKSVKIIRTGDIEDLRLVSAGDNIADGRTPVTIKVELLDEQRRVIPASASLVLSESDLQPDSSEDAANPLARNDRSVKVGPDGTVRFKPVTQSGRYHLRVAWAEGRERDIVVFVKPHFRDWILVGFAEGTAAYRDLSRNLVSLSAEERDTGFSTDGQTSFFARGKVSGSWLLTMAYDSDKVRSEGLNDRIDPNAWYTLYGDNSQQDMVAASQRKLYLKIERENFYALFGDFQTGLDSTELSRYQRRLNGLKAEYWGTQLDVLAFASETTQAYVRDQLRGDGTAGLYHLRYQNIIPGTDSVSIETRDRFNPDLILETRSLTAFLDYNLDPDSGTVYFKEPIRSQDDSFNPVFIVAEYEVDNGINDVTGGVRVVSSPMPGLKVGATAVHEGLGTGEGVLTGIDANYSINERNTLVAEFASTDVNLPGSGLSPAGATGSGSAVVLRHEYRSTALAVDSALRSSDAGFGLGQQSASSEAMRRVSTSARYNISESVKISGELSRDEQFDLERVRDMAETRLTLTRKSRDLFGGVRVVRDEDNLAAGDNVDLSQQLIGGIRQRLFDDRMTLKLEGETNVAEDDPDSVDYPHRLRMGADYRVSRQATLFAEQEWGWGDGQDSQRSLAGVRYTPWKGAQANTSMGQEINEFGPRVYANAGLVQNWQISGGWTADAGIDRVQTLQDPGTAPFDPEDAPTNGSVADDFTALFVGAGFQDEEWQWRGRAETRDGQIEDKLNLFSGLFRSLDEATTLGTSLRYLRSDDALSGTVATTATLQLDYAWRPQFGKWIVLNQTKQVIDRRRDATDTLDGTRLINNFTSNWRYDERNETSLQYGARYVFDSIDDRQYTGYTDLIGAEYRHDLNSRWDVGARTSVLHTWRGDEIDESWGVFVGYSPEKNIWVSLGYNFKGFRDNDFTGANYRDQGINLAVRIKFDQDSVRELATPHSKLKAPWSDAGTDTGN